MQREKVTENFFDQDLKEAVSELRRNEYRRAAKEASDPLALKVIELKVRTDFKLTQDDKLLLLGDIERIASLSSQSGMGHERS